MTHFKSIEKLDTAILYILELASSLSVLLLTFGLIASMANVLTKGSILSDNPTMQTIWALSQCIAIDASVAGTIIRTFRYYEQKAYAKAILYTLLSVLLLFTAAVVSNIESIQQTLNITLEKAYLHVFVSVEFLIWIRSVAIVLLIVSHAVRHVGTNEPEPVQLAIQPQPTTTVKSVEVSSKDEQINQDEQPKALPSPQSDNYERVKAYILENPKASARKVGKDLSMAASTANKWINKVKENVV